MAYCCFFFLAIKAQMITMIAMTMTTQLITGILYPLAVMPARMRSVTG